MTNKEESIQALIRVKNKMNEFQEFVQKMNSEAEELMFLLFLENKNPSLSQVQTTGAITISKIHSIKTKFVQIFETKEA